MSSRWSSYLVLGGLMLASVAIGCRAPYPTYNPYGLYGNPCVNPPGTGNYNPATGRTDPYYGAPANGVYPPNPYANPYQNYPGYPPPSQAPAGSTSKSTWQPTTSTTNLTKAEFVSNTAGSENRLLDETSDASSQWQSIEGGEPTINDRGNVSGSGETKVAALLPDRFDGFRRN